MKTNRIKLFILICVLTAVLSGCSNLPQTVTKTPTMTNEEMIEAAQGTAEALMAQTQTQYALDNPSPTPTETMTPTPPEPPTSTPPAIPPTATDAPLPYYSVKNKSARVYKIGDPNSGSTVFVPMDTLYVEVCLQNSGSGIWNENYLMRVSNQNGAGINPVEQRLGKTVGTEEWACFSFQNYNPEQSLGMHCPSFQMYSDTGVAINNAFNSVCWTIE